jgi:hypothetical protein
MKHPDILPVIAFASLTLLSVLRREKEARCP